MMELEERLKFLKHGAFMIIGSTTPPTGRMQSSVVPQSPPQLFEGDRQVLTELSIPPDKWNNLNALWAFYNKISDEVLPVQVSRPGMELSCSHVLKQIELVLENSGENATLLLLLHYYGNGRRDTGDWCFRDGFITFRDIADLYMKHSRGRVLIIVTDCHSSGWWASQCAKFLDEQGVKPCGHSAREKGILLKVAASCEAGQDSAELAYTTRAMKASGDCVSYFPGQELSTQQHTSSFDCTSIQCGKSEEEECQIAPEATWQIFCRDQFI